MSAKKEIIEEIIDIEGGYSDTIGDSGGETNWGITRGVALRYGYYGPMRSLTRERAIEIYEKRYWKRMSLYDVEKLSESIARELMDTGVNMGVSRAGEFLQRSLNVLNNRGKIYRDIVVDGWIGQQSVGALRSYLKHRGEEGERVLLAMLNSLQGAYYVKLAERRAKDEKFVYGWFENRVRV